MLPPPVYSRGRRAVDLRRFDDLVVDAAQPSQEHRHDEAGRLPHTGDNDSVDRHPGIDQPVESETLPSPGMHDPGEPEAWIEEPLPGGAGDDEGNGHRI